MEQLWSLAVIAILLGPFVVALVYGLRNRNSGTPKEDDTLEAPAMIQTQKDFLDMRGRNR
jgi:hypothetical protein